MLGKLRTVLTGLSERMALRRVEQRHARMLSVIEGQILPRLVMATAPSAAAAQACNGEPTSENVAELARLLIEHDSAVAAEYLDVLRTQGASVESLWMQLVAPTARHLNQLGSAGHVDVRRIAIAQQRLHALLLDFETRHERDRPRSTQAIGEFSPGA